MAKKLQINVMGTETIERLAVHRNLIRCNICIDGRICAFWTTEANYNALIYDGVFIHDGRLADASGVINTSNVFVEELT